MKLFWTLFFYLFATFAYSQDWNFIDYTEENKNIVAVASKNGESEYSGTGVIVGRKDNIYSILTCAHIYKTDHKIYIKTYSGSTFEAEVFKKDDERDLMWLSAKIIEDISPAELGNAPTERENVIVCGLGGQFFENPDECHIRKFQTSIFNLRTDKWIYFESSVIGGDSGGAVFNKQGKLIGIVSGGQIRFKNNHLWPGIAASSESIVEFFK